MLTYFLLGTHCGGRRPPNRFYFLTAPFATYSHSLLSKFMLSASPSPCTPPPAFIFWSAPLAASSHSVSFKFLLSSLTSIQACACVLLSWHALRPPPHPLLFFNRSLCYLLSFFFAEASFLWVHLIFIHMHRDLCLRTSCWIRFAGGRAALY